MDGSRRFCTRCGNPLDPPDRFCGRCGAAVAARAAEPVDPLADDLHDPLAEWERHRFPASPPPERHPEEATTETIPAARPGDTALLPQLPPAEVTAPPAPVQPGAEPAVPKRGFPLGAAVALVGAIAVLFSSFLPWWDRVFIDCIPPPTCPTHPNAIPLRSLLGFGSVFEAPDPSLAVALVLLGGAGGLVALLTMVAPFLTLLRRLLGLGALAIALAFALQVFLELLAAGHFGRTLDVLGIGTYVAASGGLVQLVVGRWSRRRV